MVRDSGSMIFWRLPDLCRSLSARLTRSYERSLFYVIRRGIEPRGATTSVEMVGHYYSRLNGESRRLRHGTLLLKNPRELPRSVPLPYPKAQGASP